MVGLLVAKPSARQCPRRPADPLDVPSALLAMEDMAY
jgi:hypothetical protein